MAAGRYDLYIEQGITYTKIFTWRASTGAPIDLSDYTAVMQLRNSLDDETTLIVSNTSPPDIVLTLGGALGTIQVEIPTGITNALNFDIAVWDMNLTNSSTGIITRLLEGEVKFSRAVTRAGAEIDPAITTLLGINDGDMIRWNAALQRWVIKELDEIRLTPKASSTGAEGTIFYSSLYNALVVAVEI